MVSWTRSTVEAPEDYNFHIKLTPHQWATRTESGEHVGYDKGGELYLTNDIFAAIRGNENFKSLVVARRASRTMFVPEILIKNEALPDYMCEPHRLSGLSLGPQYDMYVSFASKEEATLFKLSFRGDVGVGFSGIN